MKFFFNIVIKLIQRKSFKEPKLGKERSWEREIPWEREKDSNRGWSIEACDVWCSMFQFPMNNILSDLLKLLENFRAFEIWRCKLNVRKYIELITNRLIKFRFLKVLKNGFFSSNWALCKFFKLYFKIFSTMIVRTHKNNRVIKLTDFFSQWTACFALCKMFNIRNFPNKKCFYKSLLNPTAVTLIRKL